MSLELAPLCDRCGRRHRADLPCWRGHYAQRMREHVFREKGRRCWQCRREGKDRAATTVDHVLARARGGGDELRNLEPACGPHNSSKGIADRNPYGPDEPTAGNGQPISPRYR